jgi:hypothetical protein
MHFDSQFFSLSLTLCRKDINKTKTDFPFISWSASEQHIIHNLTLAEFQTVCPYWQTFRRNILRPPSALKTQNTNINISTDVRTSDLKQARHNAEQVLSAENESTMSMPCTTCIPVRPSTCFNSHINRLRSDVLLTNITLYN